jgi:hypothetical protein
MKKLLYSIGTTLSIINTISIENKPVLQKEKTDPINKRSIFIKPDKEILSLFMLF